MCRILWGFKLGLLLSTLVRGSEYACVLQSIVTQRRSSCAKRSSVSMYSRSKPVCDGFRGGVRFVLADPATKTTTNGAKLPAGGAKAGLAVAPWRWAVVAG